MALRAAIFGSGMVLMSLEILGGRILPRYFGSSIVVWADLISVFLVALSAGYYSGGRLADFRPQPSTLAAVLLLSAVTIILLPLWYEPYCEFLRSARVEQRLDPLLASAGMFFLPGFIMGMVTPLAIKLATISLQQVGSTAGGVIALSTAGSVVGTLATAFFFIEWWQISVTMFILGGVMAVLALAVRFSRSAKTISALCIGFLLLGASSEGHAYVLFNRYSAYHHIIVEQRGMTRILRFDDAMQSTMDLRDRVSGAFEYTDFFHAGFLFKPDTSAVLFVGLGGASGPKRFLNDYPAMRVDVVEIDPMVVEVAKRFFFLPTLPQLRVAVEDGRAFLSKEGTTYDLIAIDAYASSAYGPYIPPHLVTKEFFKEVEKKLNPGGVVVDNVIGTVTGYDSQIVRSIYKTMAEVFDQVYLFVAVSSQNVVILGTKSTGIKLPDEDSEPKTDQQRQKEKLSRGELVRRAMQLSQSGKIKIPNFVGRTRQVITEEPKLDDVPVLTDDYAPVEKMLRR